MPRPLARSHLPVRMAAIVSSPAQRLQTDPNTIRVNADLSDARRESAVSRNATATKPAVVSGVSVVRIPGRDTEISCASPRCALDGRGPPYRCISMPTWPVASSAPVAYAQSASSTPALSCRRFVATMKGPTAAIRAAVHRHRDCCRADTQSRAGDASACMRAVGGVQPCWLLLSLPEGLIHHALAIVTRHPLLRAGHSIEVRPIRAVPPK